MGNLDTAIKSENQTIADQIEYHKWESINLSLVEHSMGQKLSDYQTSLSLVSICSIVLGVPLALNMLWHLRVANDSKGRGVIRLILLHHYINLLCAPVICINLVILATPSREMPSVVCALFEYAIDFAMTSRYVGSLTIALGR